MANYVFLTVGQDSICLPPIRRLKGAFMCMKIGLFLGFDARGGVGWAVLRYCPEEALWVWQEILDFRVIGVVVNDDVALEAVLEEPRITRYRREIFSYQSRASSYSNLM